MSKAWRYLVAVLIVLLVGNKIFLMYLNKTYPKEEIEAAFEPITTKYGIEIEYEIGDDFFRLWKIHLFRPVRRDTARSNQSDTGCFCNTRIFCRRPLISTRSKSSRNILMRSILLVRLMQMDLRQAEHMIRSGGLSILRIMELTSMRL